MPLLPRSSRPRPILRFAVRSAILSVTGSLLLALVVCWRIHASNAAEDLAYFRSFPAPAPAEKILIFSPHCDDESLGLGGYIHAAVRRGADVHVVMMTNGDGFSLAAAWHYKRLDVTSRLLRRFASMRQEEAIRALQALGVGADQITFLGFPDQGLASLWSNHWSPDSPFYARKTACDHNPYAQTLHPGQVYCGQSVLADVEEVTRAFRPDLVLMPHPNDDHPDHWATSAFVRAALSQMAAADPAARPIRAATFLVHHGDWPIPQGYHPDVALAPPFSLVREDTSWKKFSLDASDERAKSVAIHRYHSQTAMMGRFLDSFVRRTEIIGELRGAELVWSPSGRGSRVVVESSPVSDTLIRAVSPGTNIESIEADQKGSDIRILVRLRGRASDRVTYTLRLKQPAPDGKCTSWRASLGRGRDDEEIPGGHAALVGDCAEFDIPISSLARGSSWFLSADTRLSSLPMDRAGWRELKLLELPDQQATLNS